MTETEIEAAEDFHDPNDELTVRLRSMLDDVVTEPVPRFITELLEKLDDLDRAG